MKRSEWQLIVAALNFYSSSSIGDAAYVKALELAARIEDQLNNPIVIKEG